MAVTKNLTTNDGQIITMSSVYLDSHLNGGSSYLPDGARAWVYERGVSNPSTALNLQAYYDDANSKTGVSAANITYVAQYHTEEVVESDAFQSVLRSIDSSMSWIWGNIENGGLGIIKVDGYIRVLQFAGIVSNSSGIRYSMVANGNHNDNDVKRRMLENCVICLTDIEEGKTPNIIIFLTDDESSSTYYTNMEYNVLDGQHYTPTFINSASALCGVCTWGSYLAGLATKYYPDRGWWVDTAYVRFTNQVQYDEMIGLGLFNGQEIDPEDDPFADSEGTDDLGGDGDFYGGSESTPAGDTSEISTDAINSGFVTLYNPTKTQMQSFNDWLWTSIDDNLSQQIKRLMIAPLEAILFIAETHLNPPTTESTSEIKFCGIGSGVYSLTIPKQFKTYDCGSLQYKTADGGYSTTVKGDTDMFLDYQPYSRAEIYIPTIGYKEIDINDLIGSEVSLTISVDWVSGATLASLTFNREKRKAGDAALNNNTIYEFEGNAYTLLPISASDWKSFYSNVLGGISSLGSMLSGTPQAILSGAANMASSVMSQQVSVQKSGSINTSYGFMAQQDVYLYVTRPNPAIPTNYKGFKGYKTNQRYSLESLSGYTEIDTDTLWTDGKGFEGITDGEAALLKEICNTGFYL